MVCQARVEEWFRRSVVASISPTILRNRKALDGPAKPADHPQHSIHLQAPAKPCPRESGSGDADFSGHLRPRKAARLPLRVESTIERDGIEPTRRSWMGGLLSCFHDTFVVREPAALGEKAALAV